MDVSNSKTTLSTLYVYTCKIISIEKIHNRILQIKKHSVWGCKPYFEINHWLNMEVADGIFMESNLFFPTWRSITLRIN